MASGLGSSCVFFCQKWEFFFCVKFSEERGEKERREGGEGKEGRKKVGRAGTDCRQAQGREPCAFS
jgi:hypothetical protein